jgi:hypothetical protein
MGSNSSLAGAAAAGRGSDVNVAGPCSRMSFFPHYSRAIWAASVMLVSSQSDLGPLGPWWSWGPRGLPPDHGLPSLTIWAF